MVTLEKDLSDLPISKELLEFYKQKLENAEIDYQNALDRINELKISHQEHHKLSWEVYKRSKEVRELQQALGDFQTTLFDERKHTLKIVAENDALKVQELKDRKKIKFLLSLSGAPEEEVTYFRDRLDKRLVKIARSSLQVEEASQRKNEEQDLIILEDEVQGLKLTVSSLQAQVQEQKLNFDNTMDAIMKERRLKLEEERARSDYNENKIKGLMDTLAKMRTLCRENTRELLRTKKISHAHERSLIEEKADLIEQIKNLHSQLAVEQERNESAEKSIESRISKKHETIVHDLKIQNRKLEENIKKLKTEMVEKSAVSAKKIEYLKTRFDQVNASYNALKRRRDYEIEGFTSDIVSLRQQLRVLEKNILKYGSLEDKELVLLNLARLTGERASKISSQLQNLKSKIYSTEAEVQSLQF
ncbi:hypothetical protein BC833DRAFT_585028 [Globomyces pollinis-pini]|nr:hypothetical protein BC833DRAFT_585028 [Globomyces pollinis-pini]